MGNQRWTPTSTSDVVTPNIGLDFPVQWWSTNAKTARRLVTSPQGVWPKLRQSTKLILMMKFTSWMPGNPLRQMMIYSTSMKCTKTTNQRRGCMSTSLWWQGTTTRRGPTFVHILTLEPMSMSCQCLVMSTSSTLDLFSAQPTLEVLVCMWSTLWNQLRKLSSISLTKKEAYSCAVKMCYPWTDLIKPKDGLKDMVDGATLIASTVDTTSPARQT